MRLMVFCFFFLAIQLQLMTVLFSYLLCKHNIAERKIIFIVRMPLWEKINLVLFSLPYVSFSDLIYVLMCKDADA